MSGRRARLSSPGRRAAPDRDRARATCRAAFVLAFDGKSATAVWLLSAIDAHREQIGTRYSGASGMNQEALRIVRTRMDEVALAAEWKEGRALTVVEAATLARSALD